MADRKCDRVREWMIRRKWETAVRRVLSSVAPVCGFLLVARTALAQIDDPEETTVTPSDFAGAAKLVVALVIAIIAGAIWYYLRRRAIVRSGTSNYRQDE